MRKITIRVLLASVTFGVGLGAVLVAIWFWSLRIGPVLEEPAIAQVKAPSVEETKAQDVSVCDLKNDPAKYNHSLVKISGYFSRGFEDSTLYDPTCKTRQWIWVELGGRRSIGVMYCCGFTPKRTREEELKVEGIKLPLMEDETFNRYDNLFGKENPIFRRWPDILWRLRSYGDRQPNYCPTSPFFRSY
jgi:hypothetical protein